MPGFMTNVLAAYKTNQHKRKAAEDEEKARADKARNGMMDVILRGGGDLDPEVVRAAFEGQVSPETLERGVGLQQGRYDKHIETTAQAAEDKREKELATSYGRMNNSIDNSRDIVGDTILHNPDFADFTTEQRQALTTRQAGHDEQVLAGRTAEAARRDRMNQPKPVKEPDAYEEMQKIEAQAIRLQNQGVSLNDAIWQAAEGAYGEGGWGKTENRYSRRVSAGQKLPMEEYGVMAGNIAAKFPDPEDAMAVIQESDDPVEVELVLKAYMALPEVQAAMDAHQPGPQLAQPKAPQVVRAGMLDDVLRFGGM